MMKFYVVFDTNVIVSALLTLHPDSPTATLLNMVLEGTIIPLYNEEILSEYCDVLSRPKFKFSHDQIQRVLALIRLGISLERTPSDFDFQDLDDAVFYEVALSKEDSYLVTGNLKHFPQVDKVVLPAEMLAIILSRPWHFSVTIFTAR